MRISLFLIWLLCTITSCSRYPDPSQEIIERYYFRFLNNPGERYLAGEPYGEPVRYNVFNSIISSPETIKVKFEVMAGGGIVSADSSFTDVNSVATTDWHLGAGSFEQVIKASAYNGKGKYLSSTILSAYGFRTEQWDTLSNEADSYMSGMAGDTVNHLTFMIAGGKVYHQADSYYTWEAVPALGYISAVSIESDRNGVIYISSSDGNIIKSTDHGGSWLTCTKPFTGNQFLNLMYVSNDNYLWAFIFGSPARYSSDGGVTWLTAGSGFSVYGFSDLFRLKDGSILFHGSDCCSLLRTFDYGETWTEIETPGSSMKLYVDDKEDVFICTQEEGMSIYKSSDLGASFKRVFNVYPEFITAMDNTFNKWHNFYYVLIPGYGILKSADLVHYDIYWVNNNLNNLFIDHNGVLIAKDWNSGTVYYRKNSQ